VNDAERRQVFDHGRYSTLQIAEVAVSRQMFGAILSLITQLRAPRAPRMSSAEGISAANALGKGALGQAKQRASRLVCQTLSFDRHLPALRAIAVAQPGQRGNPGCETAWKLVNVG
jgi:hypothetical protein